MPGSNLRTNKLSTPNSLSESCTFFSTPNRIDATTIATMVPMTTPSTVRKERTLCVRMVSSAILMSSSSMCEWAMLRLKPQSFDRIQLGCFVCRIDAKEHAHRGSEYNCANNPADWQRHGKYEFSNDIGD